ncbi:MAG: zinc ribbon domain-containing protein [Acidobacteriota bacterium]
MSDVLVEEKTCGKCGADVRSDTQFCYNCGESMDPVAVPSPVSSVLEKIDDGNSSSTAEGTPLRSAASLRRKDRDRGRKPVEVFWEPAENRANLSLIIATVLFVIFTAAVVFSALYYR